MTDTREAASRMIVLEVEHLEGNEDVRVANPFFSGYGISVKRNWVLILVGFTTEKGTT